MPTATQLEKVTLNFLENTHVGDFVEWDWTACADPERTVYVDVAGNVFIGRKEIQPQVDAWSGSIASLIVEGRNWFSILGAEKSGKVTHEMLSPINTFPNLFGDVSLVHFKVKYTTELPAIPGLPTSHTRDTFLLLDENCKLLRVGDSCRSESVRELTSRSFVEPTMPCRRSDLEILGGGY
jgi:hypothetical protein